MKERGCFIPNVTDIKFVLTVPAIWNDRSKQFMRTAAIEAGIEDDDVMLALEAEAASLFCQQIPLEHLKHGTGNIISIPGTRYMVADIGGGTADFSVHEVDEDGSLTELYRASGGPYGGIYVDENYLKIYDIIFGEGTIEQLRIDDMGEYLNILREFENKKRAITPDSESNFITRLPAIINEKISKDEKLKSVEASIFKDEIKLFKDKLKISPSLMKGFFEVSLKQIIRHAMKIVETIPNIRNILIVGGYGECSLLQESFKKEFPQSNIVIPNESSLAVIKGAVLFGHNPQAISARLLRYSYGAASDDIFDPEIHPEEKRYVDENGIERCNDAFCQLIARDTKVPSYGKVVTEIGFPLIPDQKSYDLRIYCTEKIDASVIDESFQYVGRLEISVPEYFEGEWEAEEHFLFGMTEINVSVTVRETGDKIESTFDLLE